MKEKLKELTKDTAIYGISTILSRFLNFLLVPFYTHVFSTSDNGVMAIVYVYIAFFNIIYLYGMDSAYLKFASVKDEKNPGSVFSTSFLFVVITSSILSLIILLFSKDFAVMIDLQPMFANLITYSGIILFFDAISMIPFAYLRLIRKAKKFALIKTINIIINVTLNLVLILKYGMGLEAVFISNLAASVFSVVALSYEIIRNIKFRIQSDLLKDLLKFGIPYLPAGLASMIIQVVNRPILQSLTDESTVGIYSQNYKLGIFMMLFVSMFQYAWQPFFLNNAKEKNAKEMFSKVLTYFVLIGSVVLVLLSLFIDDLVKIKIFNRTIIHPDFWIGLNIIPVILLAYLFNGIYINFTAGIFIEGKTKYIPYITGAGALVNVMFNYVLIPTWGIMGAAYATLASYIVMAGGLYFVSQKFYPNKYENKKIILIFVSLLLVGIPYYLFAQGNILFKFILLILFLSTLYIFKLIRVAELKNIMSMFRFRGKSSDKSLSNIESTVD